MVEVEVEVILMREDDWLQSVFTLQIKSLCTGLICSLCAKLFEFPT